MIPRSSPYLLRDSEKVRATQVCARSYGAVQASERMAKSHLHRRNRFRLPV